MDPALLTPRPGSVNRCDINDIDPSAQNWLRTLDFELEGLGYATFWAYLKAHDLSYLSDPGKKPCYGSLSMYDEPGYYLLPVCRPYRPSPATHYGTDLDKFRHYWYTEAFFRPGSLFQKVFDNIPHMWVTTTNPADIRYNPGRSTMQVGVGEFDTVALIISRSGWRAAFGANHETVMKAFLINFRQPWERIEQVATPLLIGGDTGYDHNLIVQLREEHGMDTLRAYVTPLLLYSARQGYETSAYGGHSTIDATCTKQSIGWWKEYLTGDLRPNGPAYTIRAYPSGKTYGYNQKPDDCGLTKAMALLKGRRSLQTKLIAVNKWFDEVLTAA